jgi:cellulose biosynthesis protein BcsQ/murein DD-endopeptidase MepM/ murein hydrolase activator NlpD
MVEGVIMKEMPIVADPDSGGIIHIANIKGGVGKTTVATNLAALLAKRAPTLLIDLDVQGSVSAALGRESGAPGRSSWELFRRRFGGIRFPGSAQHSFAAGMARRITAVESFLFRAVIGRGALTEIIVPVQAGLDFIPANNDLFKVPSSFQIHNIIYNIRIARHYYKYIVIDTPSVWNRVTQSLYRGADLNLIPVTLGALSTKSLRDYLSQVRSLVQHHPSVRIRIVKNEVASEESARSAGKLRTMIENRRFLENLCEQTVYRSKHGLSSLPQSILLDIEIPESATLMEAQDKGSLLPGEGPAAGAFEELGKRVQRVLNTPVYAPFAWFERFAAERRLPLILALCALAVTIGFNVPVRDPPAPRPLAPQELTLSSGDALIHTFSRGESLYKVAKFAISWFRARVPSQQEVADYCAEVVAIHNLTSGEGGGIDQNNIPEGAVISFFPPSKILNPAEKQLVPVYRYFMKLVKDDFPSVTGDWCERGNGHIQPHFGIDVATTLGTPIISPLSGIAIQKDEDDGGHVLVVATDNAVVFFCHMDRRFFKTGDSVRQGQVVGTVGLTGRTTGPHVHIGYGVRSESRTDVSFGKYRYLVTDPKLFYYKKIYIDNLALGNKNR